MSGGLTQEETAHTETAHTETAHTETAHALLTRLVADGWRLTAHGDRIGVRHLVRQLDDDTRRTLIRVKPALLDAIRYEVDLRRRVMAARCVPGSTARELACDPEPHTGPGECVSCGVPRWDGPRCGWCDLAAEDVAEAFEERAAIMEYEGGLSRAEAEARAAEMVMRSKG